jgi:hypothetical protein
VKRSGRGEPIEVVIHICMETTQEIFLCSYLYFKLAKVLVSIVIFCFFFFKIGDLEGRICSVGGGRRHWWGAEVVR